jgi:hypothetical protein
MKIYIAGKITGLDFLEAIENFRCGERAVEGCGHVALNPLKLVDQCESRTYEELLLDALRVVLEQAEALYMLPDWRDSKGARAEHALAEIFGKPIFYAANGLPEAS